jgi:hypothetical protein
MVYIDSYTQIYLFNVTVSSLSGTLEHFLIQSFFFKFNIAELLLFCHFYLPNIGRCENNAFTYHDRVKWVLVQVFLKPHSTMFQSNRGGYVFLSMETGVQ